MKAQTGKPGEVNSVAGPECVLVPGGWFTMGSPDGHDGQAEERPAHRVWVDAFEIAVVQVRNRDWAVFMDATGHTAPRYWASPDPTGASAELNHPDQPVVAVNWFDAVEYCEWLSRDTNRRYRLPTEAEWERAARGGREGLRYPWGDEPPQEWPEYVERWGRTAALPAGPLRVGLGSPNPFGLYDVSENVHEWCADWFDRDYYAHCLRAPERNPQGPSAGDRRASRGGSWRHMIKVSRCAARSSIPPAFEYADYGFRVVRDLL
ncbi:MAG TPA: formylglycine-generating enzyme family protein [Terriglobia bacterium]|nr:formylglycine-generating enzyme family protein [Terriglobia bacterium]